MNTNVNNTCFGSQISSMMALRVFNQISSLKLPKSGSIRSISAERSSPIHPTSIQGVRFDSNYKFSQPPLRSNSVQTKCEFRSYGTVCVTAQSYDLEENEDDDEDLQMFKTRLPSVLRKSPLPFNCEQFSTKRNVEIENITQLAKECNRRFLGKPRQTPYCLKDSSKSNFPEPEIEDAIKKLFMHHDHISGSHLQPRNLSPFDEIHGVTGETSINISYNSPTCYYYANNNKTKFFERSKNIIQQRYYSTNSLPTRKEELEKAIDNSNSKHPNVSKENNVSKPRDVPFKSYSDHVKESLSNQPNASISISKNQKRTFSMTCKSNSNGVTNLKKSVLEHTPPINLSTTIGTVSKRSIFTCDLKVDPYSVPDEKRNVRHKFLTKMENLTSGDKIGAQTNDSDGVENKIENTNPDIDTLSNTTDGFNPSILATQTIARQHPMSVKPLQHQTTQSATHKVFNNLIFGPVLHLSTFSKSQRPDILGESRPLDNLLNSNAFPTLTTLRNYSTSTSGPCKPKKKAPKEPKVHPCDRHKKKRIPHPRFPKSKLSNAVLESREIELFEICNPPGKKYEKNKPCRCIEPHLPTKLPKLKRLPKKTKIDEVKSQPGDCGEFPCPPRADENLKEVKKELPRLPCNDCPCLEPPPLNPCTALPRPTKRLVLMDKQKVCVDEECITPRADEKLVEKKKSLKPLKPLGCECIEPYLPTKLPPMKRLQKKVMLDTVPVSADCIPFVCPRRADEGVNFHHKKVLPRIDCNRCPCLEPCPLDDSAPLPRLNMHQVYQEEICHVDEPCPLKSDDVCGYDTPKKKLKPLLPCIKGYYKKNYSTMTRSFLNIQVAGHETSAICDCGKEVEEKTAPLYLSPQGDVCISQPAPIYQPKKQIVFDAVIQLCQDSCKQPAPMCPPLKKAGACDGIIEKLDKDPCKHPIPMCPPKQLGILQRLLNYFKARPNCPAPEEWKKKYLREKAEKAAKAAGLELCEPRSKVGLKMCEPKAKDPCARNGSVRHYSSSSGTWDKGTSSYFTNDTKLANEMELKQLIYRILKLMRVDDRENTSEMCNQLLEEFMDLSEEEFQYIKSIISDAHDSLLYYNAITFAPQKNHEVELEHKMIETLDLFCKKASYLRNITYLEYEELEKMKTLAMQRKLDEMLVKYEVEEKS